MIFSIPLVGNFVILALSVGPEGSVGKVSGHADLTVGCHIITRGAGLAASGVITSQHAFTCEAVNPSTSPSCDGGIDQAVTASESAGVQSFVQ